MFITPINGLMPVAGAFDPAAKKGEGGGETVFAEMLKSAVDQVNETDRISKEDGLKIATGETDNLHAVMINAEKADLALQLMVQVRNKALDAYNEIMRITL